MNATERRNIEIAARYEKGEPVATIAASYGLKEFSARNIIFMMGASRSQVKTERDETIRSAYANGVAVEELAKLHGLCLDRIQVIARSVGKAPRHWPAGLIKRKSGKERPTAQH